MVDLFRFRHWDLVSKRVWYFAFSALLLFIGIFALVTKHLNLGIDFTGGGLVTYRVSGHIPTSAYAHVISDIRDSLDAQKIDSEIQVSPAAVDSTGDALIIRTKLKTDEKAELDKQISDGVKPAVEAALAKQNLEIAPGQPNKPGSPESEEMVAGTISSELINQGVTALVVGSLLIMFWIGLRYNIGGLGFRYSFGGIIALLHDLFILVGMFAVLRDFLQVNSPFIAALLTVLGYSIHDTIVIYDRIRENIRLRKGRTFAETVNISLLETMARSVNTVLTVLFTLLALFFFGGSTLRDFTAAMLIGVVVGAYSSIFIASQLLVSWAKGKDRIILPPGEMVPAMAVAAPAATVSQPVTAGTAAAAPRTAVAEAPQQAAASREAIQRARQAGKTSKRKR